MIVNNIKMDDPQKGKIEFIISELLSCSDGSYIKEIYAKPGSFRGGYFGNWIGIMVVVSMPFSNTDLYETLDTLEDKLASSQISIVISIEPDQADRGHGIVLYKEGQI